MIDDMFARFSADLQERLHGPFSFRYVLQPMMAMLYAARDGILDARQGRPLYFWSILTRPYERRQLLREGWKAVARVMALGTVMDIVYQLIVSRWIHPIQLVVVVLTLAFVPYLLLRGLISRIARHFMKRRVPTP